MKSLMAPGLLLAILFAAPAQAACLIQTPIISLGVYDALNPAPAPVLVSVQVRCSKPTRVIVSAGKGLSNTYERRTLRMGKETVDYNLYTGTNQAQVWGDGSFGSFPLHGTVDANETVQFSGNASVYPGQSPLPGLYTDTLIFTATF